MDVRAFEMGGRRSGYRAAACLLAVLLMAIPALAQAGYASREIAPVQEETKLPPIFQTREYRLYDTASAVLVLKERLQRFGYYPPNITFDDKKYDDMLRDRMIWFQRNNGLAETGRADAPTVAALFGDGKPVVAKWYAKTDAEPQRALIIPVTKSAQWYLSAQDQFGMRIAVRNVSLKKTVSAFEISMYTEDAQGARLHDSGRMVKLCTLGPEEEMWSDYAYFDGVEGIHALCAALHRVRYADGTYEIYEDAPYERWVLE